MSALITVSPANAAPAPSTGATAGQEDSRPYDAKLLRLAELLGSIHYLRELCGANEGQFWRDTMQELMKSEGFTAGRQARLTASFNQGYRSYSRTYNLCTPTARAAIERFLAEGAQIADTLVQSAP
ncbi:MAG TPA: TIGR02301 family protein [Hyphomicrobiaceae bacterium]|nr:TIGR02301 family protein [Hyphomicrobiaceae bacterium]